MKVKGINPCYSVKIERGAYAEKKGICIILTDGMGMQMTVAISDED